MQLEKRCGVCNKRGCYVCRNQKNAHQLVFQEYMPHAKTVSRAVSEWAILNRLQRTLHVIRFLEHYRPAYPTAAPMRYFKQHDDARHEDAPREGANRKSNRGDNEHSAG